MLNLGPSPYIWLDFDKNGVIEPEIVSNLKTLLSPDMTDLVVMSHGWKNTKDDAQALYGALWENASQHLEPARAKTTVVAGISWPAKAYKTDFDAETLVASSSGTQAAGATAEVSDLDEAKWKDILGEFRAAFGPDSDGVVAAAEDVASGISSTTAFKLLKEGSGFLQLDATGADPELAIDGEGIAQAGNEPSTAQDAMAGLAAPPVLNLTNDVASAQSLAATLSGLINGPRAAAARFLNQLTYYTMKKRAGVVGVALAQSVLAKIQPASHINLHLVGHSFGARLVTAAVNENLDLGKLSLFSLTLLQGAYSHNGLAGEFAPGLTGAFPHVVGKTLGPIAITHTHNDLACTLAYALASRLSRDMTQGIGDKNDKFGAMGANGPQHLGADQVITGSATDFKPKRGKVNTFLADGYVVKTADVDAHNNVTNPTVGKLLSAVLNA